MFGESFVAICSTMFIMQELNGHQNEPITIRDEEQGVTFSVNKQKCCIVTIHICLLDISKKIPENKKGKSFYAVVQVVLGHELS